MFESLSSLKRALAQAMVPSRPGPQANESSPWASTAAMSVYLRPTTADWLVQENSTKPSAGVPVSAKTFASLSATPWEAPAGSRKTVVSRMRPEGWQPPGLDGPPGGITSM